MRSRRLVNSRLTSFLLLFDPDSIRALKVMTVVSTVLALLDFASLLVLFPVFDALVSGGESSESIALPVVGSWTPLGLVMLAMGLLILRSAGEFGAKAWWARRAGIAEVQLSSRLMYAYAYAPYSFHLSRNSSELMARAVAQVNMASAAGLNGVVSLGADLASVFAVALALLVMSPLAAVAVFAYIGVVGLGFALLSQKVVKTQTDQYSREVGQVYARAATVLRGIRELTVSGGRGAALGSIDQSRGEMVHAQQRLLLLGELPRMTLEVALYVAMLATLVLVLGSGDALHVLPTVALFVFAAMRILPAAGRSLRTLTSVRTGVEFGASLGKELADLDRLAPQEKRSAAALPPRGDLVLRNVRFSYDEGGLTLGPLSLEVPFGTTLGIVGPSGSGKSTLLSLMLGLLPPGRGNITYGDRAIGVADPAWLRRVAYVPQDVFILDDSVAANVALGDDAPDAIKVQTALERAHLWDVVLGMPDGVATQLGEGGSRLSVGQRQRLGIARALYREASLMIMDEPTAALDPESERRVVETLKELRGDVSTVLVSHRLAPLDAADCVITLESGNIVLNETRART